MTIENSDYATGWVTCSKCGVTQPKASLKDTKCINTAKCAEWKLHLERERERAAEKAK